MINILIKGWYSIYHSYAVVNYFQTKYIIQNKQDNIHFYYEETPYFSTAWKDQIIFDLPIEKYDKMKHSIPDIIYRISFPYLIEDLEHNQKQFLFYTSEDSLFHQEYFNKDLNTIRKLVKEEKLVLITPSHKSAKAFTNHNIPVTVIPHGYDPEYYYPNKKDRNDKLKVFLNISAFSPNKNIPIILKAFSSYHKINPDILLILKGSKDLYKTEENLLYYIEESGIDKSILNKVLIITDSLTPQTMNELYNSSDVYISAGEVEGFDVPIVEALATNTPVLSHKNNPNSHLASETFNTPEELAVLMEKETYEIKDVKHLDYKVISNKLLSILSNNE